MRGAIFGLGHMGSLHRSKLAARGIELVLVDPQRGHHSEDKAFDFAVIATPSSTHLEVARPLLEGGIPCLVEKPLAHDLAAAEALAAFDHLMVGHIERFNPTLDVVAGCSPAFLQAERLAPFPARGTDVSVIDDLMVHDLDLVRHFMGGEVHEVRAVGVGVLTGTPDIANVRLEVGDGVAILTASRVSRHKARSLRLVESGVYWSLDLLGRTAQRVRWGQGELDGEAVPVPDGDALDREHDAFLAMVAGAPSRVTGEDGLEALRLAAAVRAAMER